MTTPVETLTAVLDLLNETPKAVLVRKRPENGRITSREAWLPKWRITYRPGKELGTLEVTGPAALMRFEKLV